jgi:RNA polymerase sigma-70 factor (ECF subfamily)
MSQIVIGDVQPAEEFALAQDAGGSAMPASWFDGVFRDHYPRIVAMLARLTGDRAQAEEVAADVFSKLSRQPAVMRECDDLTAWIYRVATNAGLDALRANSRRRKREEEAGVEQLRTGGADSALDGVLRQERRSRVREVLATLKPRDAQLLLLRADGLAYREVAQSLGIQPGSVGTLLARAEAEFERKFRSRYGDDV